MKVALCLFRYYPYGGLERDFRRIAAEFSQRGHQVYVYTMQWEGEALLNAEVILLPQRGLSNHRRALNFSQQLTQRLQVGQYDLVLGFNRMPGLDVYYAADECYQANVQQKHNFWYRLTARYRIYCALERAVFGGAKSTEILLLTPAAQNFYQAYYQTPASRFHLLPAGIDKMRIPDRTMAVAYRLEVRQELGISANASLVLMVGSDFKRKGVDRGINALAALPAVVRANTYLVIIGRGQARSYQQQARASGVAERVVWLGPREDVGRFMLAADLLLHPAYQETAGMVLLEALVAGLPVLVTANCGYAFHVQQADAGIVISTPFSQSQLDQALALMLTAAQTESWRANALAYAATLEDRKLAAHVVSRCEEFAAHKKSSFISAELSLLINKRRCILALAPELQGMVQGEEDVWAKIFALSGEVVRQQHDRKTLRFSYAGNYYFAKLHRGIGWGEISKNLLQGRLPVLGAQAEWQAIQRLKELEVPTMRLVGYGKRGWNPARIYSFVLTAELANTISLEELAQQGQQQPQPLAPALKWGIIKQLAKHLQILHNNGVNHRDCYLCHFLLDISGGIATLNPQQLTIYIIDLHRVQLRPQTPVRWRCKDLAGLYFSSQHIGLTQRDYLRFIKAYMQQPLAEVLTPSSPSYGWWQLVQKRAGHLQNRHRHHHPSLVPSTAAGTHAATEVNPTLPLTLWLLSQPHLPLVQQRMLRFLPGKRTVILAYWGERLVVVKLFNHYRHAQREAAGVALLKAAGVTAPELLAQGCLKGHALFALIYSYIEGSVSTDKAWWEGNAEERLVLTGQLIQTTAALHQAGLYQQDLHLHNFLVVGAQIFTLDPATIKPTANGQPVTERASLKNLALLLAQLAPSYDINTERHYLYYVQARPLTFTLRGLAYLKKCLLYWRHQHVITYRKKVLRSSTGIKQVRSWWRRSCLDRAYVGPQLNALLARPEAVLQTTKVKFLKAGNTCTVLLVELDGRLLVVKRYNIKNFWHGLKRSFQTSRAVRCWQYAHCLQSWRLPTAKPVAMLEQRFGPLRRTTYFISEYIPSKNLYDYCSDPVVTPTMLQTVMGKLRSLLTSLAQMRISHGDLKATNILVTTTGEPLLVDLDAMRMHRREHSWQHAYQIDQERFMRNWQDQPGLAATFLAELFPVKN